MHCNLNMYFCNHPLPFHQVCPHTLLRMAAPVPCRFGSEASFASEEARAEAEGSYHAVEWRVARRLREAGLSPVGRLALRLVTSGTIANEGRHDIADIVPPICA